MKNPWLKFQGLGWSSDWNGIELGYADKEVVGLYLLNDTDYGFYIDMSTMEILEIIFLGEECNR